MTTVFDKDGNAVPCTAIFVLPNKVISTRKINQKTQAIIGYGPVLKKPVKSLAGQFKQSGQAFSFIGSGYFESKAGDTISAADFKNDQKVKISGTSKGKGFAGVIKRHGFSRGPESHGSDHHRATGAIGSAYPQRTFPGTRGPGHLGNKKISLGKRQIIGINSPENIIQIKGALPGPNRSYLRVESHD